MDWSSILMRMPILFDEVKPTNVVAASIKSKQILPVIVLTLGLSSPSYDLDPYL